MQSNRYNVSNKSSASAAAAGATGTDLYDLWLNSRLPAVSPSMVTGVTSSSSHQIARDLGPGIDSERLAEKLMQLSCGERAVMKREAVEERLRRRC